MRHINGANKLFHIHSDVELGGGWGEGVLACADEDTGMHAYEDDQGGRDILHVQGHSC